MKKLIIALLFVGLVACKGEKEQPIHPEYAVVSGTITGYDSQKSLDFSYPENGKLTKIKPEITGKGAFRDTLTLTQPTFLFVQYGENFYRLYLKNGMDIQVAISPENKSPLSFKGRGAIQNNLFVRNMMLRNKIFGKDLKAFFNLEKSVFEQKVTDYINQYSALLAKQKSVDTTFFNTQTKQLEQYEKRLYLDYDRQQKINLELAKGMPSPVFTDYVNFDGSTTSLSDFKGKYVYIDLWATWCKPCKYEIPYLKKIEEKYEGKNIAFVSISVDFKKDVTRWEQMVKDKKLGGVQLIANKAFNSEFVQGYYVQGIPRFILIDPKGNIVDYNAPRPSDPKLIELFNSLSI